MKCSPDPPCQRIQSTTHRLHVIVSKSHSYLPTVAKIIICVSLPITTTSFLCLYSYHTRSSGCQMLWLYIIVVFVEEQTNCIQYQCLRFLLQQHKPTIISLVGLLLERVHGHDAVLLGHGTGDALLATDGRLTTGQTRHRDTKGTARDVVQTDLVKESNRRRIASVFAAELRLKLMRTSRYNHCEIIN